MSCQEGNISMTIRVCSCREMLKAEALHAVWTVFAHLAHSCFFVSCVTKLVNIWVDGIYCRFNTLNSKRILPSSGFIYTEVLVCQRKCSVPPRLYYCSSVDVENFWLNIDILICITDVQSVRFCNT